MKRTQLILALCVFVLLGCTDFASAWGRKKQREVTLAEVQALVAPLNLKDVERVFGKPTSMPGPCFSYQSVEDKEKVFVFWYGRPTQGPNGLIYEIAYVTFERSDNTGPRVFVWPKVATALDVGETLSKLYQQ